MSVWGAAITAGVGLYSANKSRKTAKSQAAQDRKYQQEQNQLLEQQKQAYRDITLTNPYADMENAYGGLQTDFSNLAAGAENVYAGAENMFAGARNTFAGARNTFAGMENAYAGLENQYEGMENRFEDMTVDTRAAQFQAQQGRQQRANIMQGLRGAAGSSGIAGLAQSLANQGALQAQQISAGIGQQERQNQMLAAQEGSRIDQLQRGAGMQLQQLQAGGAMSVQQAERAGAAQQQQMRMSGAMQQQQMQMKGAAQAQAMQLAGASEQQKLQLAGAQRAQALGVARENLIAAGASQADMAQRGGDAMLQQAEMSRQATLLGMQMGESSGANQQLQMSLYNQQQSNASSDQMMISALGGLGGAIGSIENPFGPSFSYGYKGN